MDTHQLLFWIGFNVFVVLMLVLDLGVFHRKAHVIRFREALLSSLFWVALAAVFAVGVYFWRGPATALEFTTGYLVEESLSIDNLFVFLLIFRYFRVDPVYQHKVLFWGILGALIMRAVFILAGVGLIHRFHWIIYVFGACWCTPVCISRSARKPRYTPRTIPWCAGSAA
jgi:tellurite resistance protein TerC